MPAESSCAPPSGCSRTASTSSTDYFEKGYINKVVTTNLTYLPPELYEKPYFVQADMSKFLALIIDSLNHDITIGKVLNPTDKIHALLEKYKNGETF